MQAPRQDGAVGRGTAWLGAVLLHTSLCRPSRAEAALISVLRAELGAAGSTVLPITHHGLHRQWLVFITITTL